MKKIACLCLAAVLLAGVLGAATAQVASAASATLIADFSSGSVEPNIKKLVHKSRQAATAEELAKALSAWTGLNFTVTVAQKGDALVVDWAADSTLIANLDDRPQKKEFHFFDADSMRWFMMDSLWRTLNEAFHKDVYYTMDGGNELKFKELSPINVFPSTVPYMGSPFYFAHDDGRNDMKN